MEQTTASTGLDIVLIVRAKVKSVSEENNGTWFHLSHRPLARGVSRCLLDILLLILDTLNPWIILYKKYSGMKEFTLPSSPKMCILDTQFWHPG